jgi:chromosome segregation ATPase
MAECPAGRTNRGTRSQFRLGTPAVGLFRGLHPVLSEAIMDYHKQSQQSSQTGVLSARDLVSPTKGTRTFTVREYEQTIDELKKENFDLKLRLHLLEESMKKFSSKEKEGCSPDKNTVQVVVQLKLETESLRKDLAYKEKVLQDALEQVEKYKLGFKELEDKYVELQNHLSSLSELPSKQEFLSLHEQKENLLKQTELLEETLRDKDKMIVENDQEIHIANKKIEILANQNTTLEEKLKKRVLAIQSFVHKDLKEKEMFPVELRNVVLSATQAAKNQNKENLALAVKSISSVLNQIMSSSVQKLSVNESEEKENIRCPQAKCLEEEHVRKSSSTFLPSQTESFSEVNHIQSLKEVLSERNTIDCKEILFDPAVHNFCMKGKRSESSINVPEKDVLECIDFSEIPLISLAEESSTPDKHRSQLHSFGKDNLIALKSLDSSGVADENSGLSKIDISHGNSKDLDLLAEENKKLKSEVKDKLSIIEQLSATCKELELKGIHFQENDASKASKRFSVYTQTDMSGFTALNEYDLNKLQNDAKLSSNVDELREDVLLLLLAIEDKNKELGDVKEALSAVQEDLSRALNSSSNVLNKEYANERNEIHERLAFSCSVNIELMKHLRNLEEFMEDLLQHKFDSSMESISEKSDFLLNVSKCLNESLKLSNVLSDHLSVCEGSKLFEDCESVLYKSYYSDDKSLPNINLSAVSIPDQHSSTYPGTEHLEDCIPFVQKNDERMAKELDGSQLCWRCWQQLNSSLLNKSETSHPMQNVSSKFMPYPSSDSDIWSEPDRNISMQRIGISLQNSPVSSKSPRKLRLKEKRLSNKLSSDVNSSSSEMHRWSKQRRHGSVSRRLFARESIKNMDFTSEKFYFLLAEKYSKLKSLLEALESMKDSQVSDEVWIKMNAIVACLGEALQKLHIAKENGKNLLPSTLCGKCIMLELFMDLKSSHKSDFCVDDLSSDNEILQQFQKELHLLKEACKEPFSLFPENADMRSQSTQSDTASDGEQVKVSELEDAVVDLSDKNRKLSRCLEEVKKLLSKEKECLESAKLEKSELSTQISSLEEQLIDVKQKENELSLKNEELKFTIKDLEKKVSTVNKISASTQCNLAHDNEEVKINKVEDVDANDKNLSISLEEKTEKLFSKEKGVLESVKAENIKLANEIHNLKEELLAIKQNKKELSSKNEDLMRELSNANKSNRKLDFALKDLEEKRKAASDALNQVAIELEKNKSDLVSMSEKCLDYENQLNKHLKIKEEYEKNLKYPNSTKMSDKVHDSSINAISIENADEKFHSTERKSANYSDQIKINELENRIVYLNDKNQSLSRSLETVKTLLSKERERFELVKSENLELCTKIGSLKEELLVIKQKEEDVSLKNEELVEDLRKTKKKNSELSSTLKGLEEIKKESTVALDQLTADLQRNKLDLVNMNMKCLEYEKELNKQLLIKDECEKKVRSLESSSISEKETLHKNISHLNSEKSYYQKQLNCVENEKQALEEENTALRTDLKSKCNELSSLQEKTHLLQEAKETLSYNYKELQKELENAKEEYENLQKKCYNYEEEVHIKLKSYEKEFNQQFKKLETESIKEKEKLLKQISDLTVEREAIFKKIKAESDYYEKLLAEKNELNKRLSESIEQTSSLKVLNEELKNKQQSLLQRNEFFENALLSSNSECKSLSEDLKSLRQTLQHLESKCMVYEREIAATANMKDSLVDCLLSINCEFLTNRQKLNEMCKVYGKEVFMGQGEASSPDFIPVIDENNVKILCERLCVESKKLYQSVDILLELLKTFHSRARETLKTEKKCNLKTSSLSKEVEFHKAEREHLKSQNDNFQRVIDELQKSILKKEKYIEYSAFEIQSLKEKICKSEEGIHRGNELLKRKDDEIIKLQEKVFNLQSYINTVITDKTNVQDKSTSVIKDFVDDIADSVSSNSPLPSTSVIKQVSVEVQTKGLENSLNNTDESSTMESSTHNCCEKYIRKCHSFQTKLALLKKHVEILEKEKSDLQERHLILLQNKNTSVSEAEESVNAKLVDLESQLEQKKTFIRELKADLLKTCNSLIDKQREVDDLKDKLSEFERKSKSSAVDTLNHSFSSPKAVDSKVKSLKNYKWTLIQTIFDIQRQFYERKGIHLNYFNTFKDHVNNLYSMQLTHSLSKAESMPILGSYSLTQLSSQEDKIKSMFGLELDIQCLENLKIFLNRFFVPCLVQAAQSIDGNSSKLESVEKMLSSDRLYLDHEVDNLTLPRLRKTSSVDISFPECTTNHLLTEPVQSSEHLHSFENFASNISQHLDFMENFFGAVRKCQGLESYDPSVEESLDKIEVKSLLLQIFEEMRVLQVGAEKLFSFNALLKNYDFVTHSIPLSSSRPDVSDKESVMSEETIGISRSESPLSIEELCPVKLPSSEILRLEEKTIKPQSHGGVTVNEPYSAKVTGIESSCDSVCQRSHYSSPDLGIESDPNHESSAPEQKDEVINKYPLIIGEKKVMLKVQQKTAFTSTESAGRFTGMKFGQTLYSIGELPHYELLKREIQESLVGIKSVLSRTGDGLHHVAKYTSPRKTLEYSTLKAIKDSCANIEVCLKEAYTLIGKFWIAACPSEKEWNALVEENQTLINQLTSLKTVAHKQEEEFKRAMGKLEHAQLLKSNMEKKISKKLVKTKHVIRKAEFKLLENRCHNLRPVPKYPSEQATSVEQQLKENV